MSDPPSDLYPPGVRPIPEGLGRQLQVQARSALQLFGDDPSGAAEMVGAGMPWRSLPEVDRQLWLHEIQELCEELVEAADTAGVDRVMQSRVQIIMSWGLTARSWEEFGTEAAVVEYSGDGGALTADSAGSGGDADHWQVRGASASVGTAWGAAAGQVPGSTAAVFQRLAVAPLEARPIMSAQVPLRGQLGVVAVRGRELEQWWMRVPAVGRGRRGPWNSITPISSGGWHSTTRDGFWEQTLTVLYAPDPADRVVWVTRVHLV